MAETQKSQNEDFLLEEGASDKIDWKGLISGDLEPAAKTIMDTLTKDEEFNKQVDKLLTQIKNPETDLTKLQAEVQALIQTSVAKLTGTEEADLSKLLKGKEIVEHVKDLSSYMMIQRSDDVGVSKETMKERVAGGHSDLDSASRKNLTSIMKRFVVYETYKILSPVQIAGETREQAYEHDFIIRGRETAHKDFPGEHNEKKDRELDKLHAAAVSSKGLSFGAPASGHSIVNIVRQSSKATEHNTPHPEGGAVVSPKLEKTQGTGR